MFHGKQNYAKKTINGTIKIINIIIKKNFLKCSLILLMLFFKDLYFKNAWKGKEK